MMVFFFVSCFLGSGRRSEEMFFFGFIQMYV